VTGTNVGEPEVPTVQVVQKWLVGKIAVRLEVPPEDIDTDKYFDEFGLDSMEALMLSAELESWLGWELEPTALWYHPTIPQLAEYISESARERITS
jgi:acyl carrier protein